MIDATGQGNKTVVPDSQLADNMEGQILDRKYRLIRMLGEGGMGAVYEAEHTLIQRRVAIKVMHPLVSCLPESVARFLREARAAGTIGHPNIVQVHDVVEEDGGIIFIVMELLKGESLDTILRRETAIPPTRAVAIILQVLSALHAAHQKGILHRDLKPENIFLSIDARMREEVKLLDFGVAKFVELDSNDSMRMTKTGAVLGTPYYLAPEQAKGGKNIDARIDIWSAGVVIYEMLTGRPPFLGDNYNEVLGKILLEEHEPLIDCVPNLSKGLAAAIEKSLEKKRNDRYQDVAEMIERLLPFLDFSDFETSTGVYDVFEGSFGKMGRVKESPLGQPGEGTPSPAGGVRAPPPVPRPNDMSLGAPDDEDEDDQDHKLDSYTKTTISGGYKSDRLGWLGPKIRVVRFAIAAVIALLAAGGYVFVLGGSEKDETADPQRKMTPEPERPDKVARTEEQKSASPASKEVEQPKKMVFIELAGLPKGAKLVLDKTKVTPPITVSRSKKPMILKITAPGYQPLDRALIPDKDQKVVVEMKKKLLRKRRPRLVNKPQKGKPKKQRPKGEGWAKNPFGR